MPYDPLSLFCGSVDGGHDNEKACSAMSHRIPARTFLRIFGRTQPMIIRDKHIDHGCSVWHALRRGHANGVTNSYISIVGLRFEWLALPIHHFFWMHVSHRFRWPQNSVPIMISVAVVLVLAIMRMASILPLASQFICSAEVWRSASTHDTPTHAIPHMIH
ncbi:hypothetical protein F4860DRAFT_79700 [Xylaria cubensis]|nr:hypothetical protein F4860DRAFT_79700 [Xylaria cubensis]